MIERISQGNFSPNPIPAGSAAAGLLQEPRGRSGRRGLTFLCVLLAGLAVTFVYAATREKIYQSSATLRVYAPPGGAADTDGVSDRSTSKPAQLLLSRPILSNVLLRLPRNLTPSNLTDAPTPDRTAALRQMVTVRESADANLIELSASGSDRELLPEIVNAWLDVYLEHDEALRSKEDNSAALALAAEQAVLQQRINAKREEIEAFKQDNDIQSMQREDNIVSSRLRGLNDSLNKAEQRLAETQGNLESVRSAIAAGKPVGTRREVATIVQLESRATELKVRAAELESKYTPAYIALNPEMRAIFEQIKVVEEDLASKRQEIERAALLTAEQEAASAAETVRRVQQELNEHKQRSEFFSSSFARFEALRLELEELEALSRDLNQRLVRHDVANKGVHSAPEVLERGSTPTWPISPDYYQIALIGFVGSFLLALLAVWMRDYLGRPEITAEPHPNVFYSVVDARSIPLVQSGADQPKALAEAESSPPQLVSEPAAIDDEVITRLIEAAPDSTRLLILLLLCGVSAREASKLRWRDLRDLSVRVGTGTDERELRLPPVAQPLAKRLRKSADGAAHVWHDGAGNPLAESELDALIVYAAYEANLPEPNAVDTRVLRHAHISYLLRVGANLSTIDRTVGYLAPSAKVRYRSIASEAPSVEADQIDTVHPVARAVDWD